MFILQTKLSFSPESSLTLCMLLHHSYAFSFSSKVLRAVAFKVSIPPLGPEAAVLSAYVSV